jgi:hypothetical protein
LYLFEVPIFNYAIWWQPFVNGFAIVYGHILGYWKLSIHLHGSLWDQIRLTYALLVAIAPGMTAALIVYLALIKIYFFFIINGLICHNKQNLKFGYFLHKYRYLLLTFGAFALYALWYVITYSPPKPSNCGGQSSHEPPKSKKIKISLNPKNLKDFINVEFFTSFETINDQIMFLGGLFWNLGIDYFIYIGLFQFAIIIFAAKLNKKYMGFQKILKRLFLVFSL